MPGAAEQILKDLSILKEVETTSAKIKDRSKRSREVIRHYQDLRAKVADVTQIDDKDLQASERKVMTATLQELRDDTEQERKDLAKAYLDLKSYLSEIGVVYQQLDTYDAKEQAVIDNAKRLGETAKQDLTNAEQQLREAEQTWRIFGIRTRAIRAANKAIVDANAAIASAEQGVLTAEAKANDMRRQRRLSSTIDQLLDDYMESSEKTVDIMDDRRRTEEEELKVVGAEKARLLEDKEEAAIAVKKLEKIVTDKKEELRQAELKLGQLENGTPAYAAQDTVVSELRTEVENSIGAHNAALTLYETCENFAQQAAVHEQSHIKLRNNLIMWITALREETKARRVMFGSRLKVMQAASDQEVAKMHDDLGAEEDIRSTEHVAAVGAASDRMRLQRFQDYPRRIMAIHNVALAQVKAHIEVDEAMQEVYAECKDRWGIDPLELSFVQQEKN